MSTRRSSLRRVSALTAGLLAAFLAPGNCAEARTYLIDFGGGGFSNQSAYGAVATASPDANGNYWNNSQGGPGGQPSNLSNIVSTANLDGGISLTWTNWGGGVATTNMGVTNVPVSAALFSSPLNIATATADSVFRSTAGTNRFFLDGLSTNILYQISIFASRTATSTRSTLFAATGASTVTNVVQTSGTNLSGAGLHYSTAPWTFTIAPDTNGRVTLDYSIAAGGFAYLNALSVTATTNPVVTGPPPYLVDFGGIGNTNQTASGLVPTASPDANGNRWNNSAGGNYGRPANITGMIDALGGTSPVSLVWLEWGSGVGANNLGVSNVPADSLLSASPLNIPTAVQDAVYTQDRTNYNAFVLKGLDPSRQYNLGILASRASTNARYTDFQVTGATVLGNRVQTSGSDLSGPGLHYSSAPANFTVAPNIWGELTVKFRVADIGENFAYINALSLLPTTLPSGNPTNLPPAINTLFGRWAYENGRTNAADMDPFADPSRSGMVNLLQYGLAGGGTAANSGQLFPATFRTNGYLAMTYRQRTNDQSMSVRSEYASSMGGTPWSAEGQSNGPVAVATNALADGIGRLITVVAPQPMSATGRGFLRVAANQRVLALGSSIMNRWTTIEQDLAPVPVLKQAVDGSTTSQWPPGAPENYWETRVATQRNPAMIFYLGGNDIADGADASAVYGRTLELLSQFWALQPGAPVLYVSIIRSPLKAANGQAQEVDWLNADIAAYASTPNLTNSAGRPLLRFVDVNTVLVDAAGNELEPGLFTSDNNHLTAAGYQKMTSVIKPAVQALWEDRAP